MEFMNGLESIRPDKRAYDVSDGDGPGPQRAQLETYT